jgi:serine O-acetyltransferase
MTIAQTQTFAETPLAGSVWNRLRLEAASAAAEEPMLASFLNAAILRHDGLTEALAHRVAAKMSDSQLDALQVHDVAKAALEAEHDLVEQAAADMLAVDERDPACRSLLQPFLYFKGFHSLLCYRIATASGGKAATRWRFICKAGCRNALASTCTPPPSWAGAS